MSRCMVSHMTPLIQMNSLTTLILVTSPILVEVTWRWKYLPVWVTSFKGIIVFHVSIRVLIRMFGHMPIIQTSIGHGKLNDFIAPP